MPCCYTQRSKFGRNDNKSKSEKDYMKQLDINQILKKDKLNLEFKNESSRIIVRNKKLSEIIFKDSYIDVADSILDSLAMVSKGI